MHFLIIQVTVTEQPTRSDLAVIQALERLGKPISRRLLKESFQNRQILLRGKPLSGSSLLPVGIHEVQWLEGESIANRADHSAASACSADLIPLNPVVYEDEDILVLHKASGIPSAPHNSEETGTAVGVALHRCPALIQIGEKKLEPGLLHRLDTGTSGLLAFAKSTDEYARLRMAWKNREVVKIYRAIVPTDAQARFPLKVNIPLAHDFKSSKKMTIVDGKRKHRGKPIPATTILLASRQISGSGFSELDIQLETGVMHQIRCHLAYLGWSILGDRTYKGAEAKRLHLHAWKLKLPLRSGGWIQLESQIPEDFNFALSSAVIV